MVAGGVARVQSNYVATEHEDGRDAVEDQVVMLVYICGKWGV